MFVPSSERQPTNRNALYFSIALVIALLSTFGYCLATGDIYRLINGYDDCGNVCGRKNQGNSLTYCGPNDKSNYPYTLWNQTEIINNQTVHRSTCVDKCENYPGFEKIANRCVPIGNQANRTIIDDLIEYLPDDMAKSWPYLLASCVVAAIFSFIILVLFRYVIKQIIWGIYIGIIVGFLAACVALIIVHFTTSNVELKQSAALLITGGILGVVGFIIAIFLYLFRKRIRMVIEIFKETAKVLMDAPGLLIQPFATFVVLLISFSFFIFAIVVFSSSGKLVEEKTLTGQFIIARYSMNAVSVVGQILNAIIFYWFTMFAYGCQHFIIASVVSQWYFTRDKSKLDSPQTKGFSHLFKFHMGSICFGSYLIMIVKIILSILRGLAGESGNSHPALAILRGCFKYILDMIERLLEFLLRNSYIIVALEGTGLIPSGKRAIKLLKNNLMDVIALNQFGDIVMVIARIFIALLAGTLCYSLIYNKNEIVLKFAPAIIAAIIAFFIIHCFMAVFEMGVDTVFICFCIDYEKNDGNSTPYYMSPKLQEAMRSMKELAGGSFNFGGGNQIPPNQQPLVYVSSNNMHQFGNNMNTYHQPQQNQNYQQQPHYNQHMSYPAPSQHQMYPPPQNFQENNQKIGFNV